MKLTDFSFVYPWELRKRAVVEGGVPSSLLILLVLFFGALLAHNSPLTSIAQEKETMLIDDAYLCTHIHEAPIEQHTAILEYCLDLKERGL